MLKVLFLSLTLLGSCSGLRREKSSQSSEKKWPSWVNAPLEACPESRSLCATGEGRSASEADAQAFKSLAAIFEAKIDSQTSSTVASYQQSGSQQVSESAHVSVREEVKQTLEAASIEKRFRHQQHHYSFAVLDKGKASQNLKSRMDKLQAELMALWEKKDRAAWAKMWSLSQERERLNDRYTILLGTRANYRPDMSELQTWYQARQIVTPMGFEAQDVPAELLAALKARLTNAGYRLFELTTGARVRAMFKAQKEHLNVDGFEKWFFVLNVENISKAGAKVGGLVVQETAVGRSRVDCESKARDKLLQAMEENLTELNLANE